MLPAMNETNVSPVRRAQEMTSLVVAIASVALLATLVSACTWLIPESVDAGSVAVVVPGGASCVDLGTAAWSPITAVATELTVGEEVGFALVVPESDVTDVFPWQPAQSSDTAVLVSDHPCADTPALSTLPVRYALFRAVAAGDATVSAALAPNWSPPSWCGSQSCTPLAPVTLTVVVVPLAIRAPVPTPAGGPPIVLGTVTAGPVCPVELHSPDPKCAPRPVAGAVIVATDANGEVVGRATTRTDGSYVLVVSEIGTILITAQPVQGLARAPAPVTVTLVYLGPTARLDLEYDTGIR